MLFNTQIQQNIDIQQLYKLKPLIKTESKVNDITYLHNAAIDFSIERHLNSENIVLNLKYNNFNYANVAIQIILNNEPLPITNFSTQNTELRIITGLNKIKPFKYSDLRHIVINIYDKTHKKLNKVWHTHSEIIHPKQKQDFQVTSNGWEVRIPLKIKFKLVANNYAYLFNNNKCINIDYAAISFIPIPIRQYKYNQTLFIIKGAIKNEYNQFVRKLDNHHLQKTKYKIINLPHLNKEQDLLFEYNEDYLNSNDDTIGKLVFINNTYYDYKDQQTKLGFGFNSRPGYLVPYNFKGIFYPTLIINLFKDINNLLITMPHNIKKPILHPEYGRIKLTIDEDIDIKNKLMQMNYTNQEILNILEYEYTLEELITLSKNEYLITNVN
ncbi:MHO_1580 family protein [Mycoplasma phocoenae]|uniref:Uncharacterized protein n=1 Tax=Mycoplasma phocoenae TaxID=754517 RepID=A0A858U3S7_9MOLU|nr:hypothetical protein [Mycoplasma phocoenae]QJG67082.1 hypothetical protein HGG69_02030 [Mycoplasma phocoenae]